VDGDMIFRLVLVVFGAGWVIWTIARSRRDLRRAVNWPSVEAMVQSGQMEVVETKDFHDVILPCFDFLYVISGRTYPGRFSVGTPLAMDESIIPRIVGLKLIVRYDPKDPSIYYIPIKKIEGYDVGQRLCGFAPKEAPTRVPGFYPKAPSNLGE